MITGPWPKSTCALSADGEIEHHRGLRCATGPRARGSGTPRARCRRSRGCAPGPGAWSSPGYPGHARRAVAPETARRWRGSAADAAARPTPAATLASSGIGPAGSSQPRCAASSRSAATLTLPTRSARRDRAVGLAQPQPLNDLTILIHLEPPVAHRVPFRQKSPEGNAITEVRDREPLHLERLHYAANPLARFGRESAGSITPRIRWPHYAANGMAPCGRELTPRLAPLANHCAAARESITSWNEH